MRLLPFIFLLAISAFADDAVPRSWKRHLSVEEEFTNSISVFVGTVVASRRIVDKDGFIQGTFYKVRVDEALKGTSPATVEMFDENSSGRFPMSAGVRYFLFAYQAPFDGIQGLHLAISNRGNSGMLKNSKRELAIVRELEKARKLEARDAGQSIRPPR